MMWTILNYIEPYANQFQIMFWAIFKQYWQINAQYCEQNFQPYCSCEHGRLTILLKVLFNIVYDIVLDIAQHCMQCCVQYWLSNSRLIVHIVHIVRRQTFNLLYAFKLDKIVQISQRHGTQRHRTEPCIEQDTARDADNARETSETFILYHCGEVSAIIGFKNSSIPESDWFQLTGEFVCHSILFCINENSYVTASRIFSTTRFQLSQSVW